MNGSIFPKTTRWLFVLLAVFVVTAMVVVPAAQAKRYLSDSVYGGSEGDPLDANDYSSDGGLIGDDIQDNYSVGDSTTGGVIFVSRTPDAVIYVIVDFQGVIPVLQVVKVPGTSSLSEAPDAR